jgi:glycosyltransferase involved in cell wall biosynthesis
MSEQKVIWIFSHYSQQPPYNTGLRYHNWGKILANNAFNVTIFCASSCHGSGKNLIDGDALFIEDECDGIKYVNVRTRSYKGNGKQRLLNMLDFYKRLPKVARKYNKPDVIIARGPHPLTCRAGIKMGRELCVPCICDIADLWPQSIVEHMNISQAHPVIKLLYQFEKWIYRKCDALIFSMEGGSEYIRDRGWDKTINMNKIFNINMGVDIPEYDKNLNRYELKDDDLLRDDIFKFVYCGSIRKANEVKIICDGAGELLKIGMQGILFFIYGYGNQEEELKQYCESNGIVNVRFRGRIDKCDIPFLLTHADVNILNYHSAPLLKYGGSMSKLFEYFASGKPVLSTVRLGYSLIERYGCGYTTPTTGAADFADGVLYFYNMPADQRQEMGRRARQAAEDYSQPILVDKVLKALEYVGVH